LSEFVRKSFHNAEETVEFPKATIEVVTVSGIQVRRLTCEPGWVWSQSVGSQMGSESCPLDHALWIVASGRFAVAMESGATEEFGPGDIGCIPPGHDAWVVGNEPVVGFDILAESLEMKTT
jgi:mannose-6-phosphate isomerase-like protein (cupin superfamily)